MTAILFLIFGPFIFLITRSALGESVMAQTFTEKLFLGLFITLITIYFLTLYAKNYNFYIIGYRSTSILFIIMTIIGIIYWLIDRRKVLNNLFRTILFCFSIVTIALSFFLLIELFDDYKNQLFYYDNKFRLEDTRRGILEPCTLPNLFVKKDFYEQIFILINCEYYPCLSKLDISEINVREISSSKVIVTYTLIKESSNDAQKSFTATYVKK
jgi:hypothetical protein